MRYIVRVSEGAEEYPHYVTMTRCSCTPTLDLLHCQRVSFVVNGRSFELTENIVAENPIALIREAEA